MNNWCIICDREKQRNHLYCDRCEKEIKEEEKRIKKEWKGNLFKRRKR